MHHSTSKEDCTAGQERIVHVHIFQPDIANSICSESDVKLAMQQLQKQQNLTRAISVPEQRCNFST